MILRLGTDFLLRTHQQMFFAIAYLQSSTEELWFFPATQVNLHFILMKFMSHSPLQPFTSVYTESPIIVFGPPLKWIQFYLWFCIPTGLVSLPSSVSSDILYMYPPFCHLSHQLKYCLEQGRIWLYENVLSLSETFVITLWK